MTIIEQNIVGKISPETCEDGIVVTESHVAVIDGSTSKGIQLFPDQRNGRMAMQLVSFLIECLDEESDADFCLQLLTEGIHASYPKGTMERVTQHKEDRLTCSAAIYSHAQHEVWMIGDCLVMVNGELFTNDKPTEQPMADERARVLNHLIETEGLTADEILADDPGRRAIMPMLLDSMAQQQVTYSVIDGFPIPRRHVRIIPVPEGAEVVLATDGYPWLFPTLAESEEALSRQLKEDPLMIGPRFRATKAVLKGQQSFDDRAFVRFEV